MYLLVGAKCAKIKQYFLKVSSCWWNHKSGCWVYSQHLHRTNTNSLLLGSSFKWPSTCELGNKTPPGQATQLSRSRKYEMIVVAVVPLWIWAPCNKAWGEHPSLSRCWWAVRLLSLLYRCPAALNDAVLFLYLTADMRAINNWWDVFFSCSYIFWGAN